MPVVWVLEGGGQGWEQKLQILLQRLIVGAKKTGLTLFLNCGRKYFTFVLDQLKSKVLLSLGGEVDYKQLGQFIAQTRKEMGCTQQALADHLGISRVTISALEKGRSGDVGVRKVMKILDYLGYEVVVRQCSPFPTLEELRGD